MDEKYKRMDGINRGIMQHPRPQTLARNPVYMPHMIINAAPYNPRDERCTFYNPRTGKHCARREGARKLREWMLEEEQEINRRFRRTG